MKDELQLAPLTSRFGVAQARVAPDTEDCSAARVTAMSAICYQRSTGTPVLRGGMLGTSKITCALSV